MQQMQASNRFLAVVAAAWTLALSVALLVPAGAEASRHKQPKEAAPPAGPQVSKGAVKPLQAIQALVDQKQYAQALEKLAELEGLKGKTPGDQYYINQFRGLIYIQDEMRNYRAAADAYEANLASGLIPPDEVNARLQLLTQLNLATEPRNLQKAIEFGTRYLEATGSQDLRMLALVTEAHYFNNSLDQAVAWGEKALARAAAAGEKPAENTLLILQRTYAGRNDAPNALRMSTALVRDYPKPDYWDPLTSNLLREAGNDKRRTLQVFRLIDGLGLMRTADDYREMSELAMGAGFPGEAQRVLEAGMAAKVFGQDPNGRYQQLLADARREATADKAVLGRLETEARGASTGEADATLGEAFLSYGQADKAIEALQRGLGKGGIKNTDDAQISLGRAYLAAGKSAEAREAFGRATGDLALIGELWGIHASQR